MGDERATALRKYMLALQQTRQQEAKIATLRANLKEQKRLFQKSESDLLALQVRLPQVLVLPYWLWAPPL